MSLWFLVLLQSSKRFEFYEKKHECRTEHLLCIIVCLLSQASAFNFLLHIAFVLTPYIIQLNTVVPYVWLIQLVILSVLLAQFSTWFTLVFIILLKHLLQYVIFLPLCTAAGTFCIIWCFHFSNMFIASLLSDMVPILFTFLIGYNVSPCRESHGVCHFMWEPDM